MSSEHQKKPGMSAKSPEATKLRTELAMGAHGDINKTKGIKWKDVWESDPDYYKHDLASFSNTGRAIRKELVAFEVAKRHSQRMKASRDKVQGELIAAPSSSHIHFTRNSTHRSHTPAYFFVLMCTAGAAASDQGNEYAADEEPQAGRHAPPPPGDLDESHVPLMSTNQDGDTVLYAFLAALGCLVYKWMFLGVPRVTVEARSGGLDMNAAEFSVNPEKNSLDIVAPEPEGFYDESLKSYRSRMLKARCDPRAIPAMYEARAAAVRNMRGSASTNEIITKFSEPIPLEEVHERTRLQCLVVCAIDCNVSDVAWIAKKAVLPQNL